MSRTDGVIVTVVLMLFILWNGLSTSRALTEIEAAFKEFRQEMESAIQGLREQIAERCEDGDTTTIAPSIQMTEDEAANQEYFRTKRATDTSSSGA